MTVRSPTRIAFDVPLPPVSGRLVMWIDEARAAIRDQQQRAAEPVTIAGFARLKVCAGLVEPPHVLALTVAPIVEVLAAAGVVASAEAVTDTEARWDHTITPGRVAVEVRPTCSPRARAGAAARRRNSVFQKARWAAERAAKADRAAG